MTEKGHRHVFMLRRLPKTPTVTPTSSPAKSIRTASSSTQVSRMLTTPTRTPASTPSKASGSSNTPSKKVALLSGTSDTSDDDTGDDGDDVRRLELRVHRRQPLGKQAIARHHEENAGLTVHHQQHDRRQRQRGREADEVAEPWARDLAKDVRQRFL